MGGPAGDVPVRPLERRDPPALGDVELIGRLAASDSGVVYAGRVDGKNVAVVLLTEGAETDSYARARFHDTVTDTVAADGATIVAADGEPDVAPWVAVRADRWREGLASAQALLAPVTMEHVAAPGPHRGPGYRPHWSQRRGVGRWRMWPLPWPATLGSASRWTFAASFALVLAIAALALFVAIKIFENQGPAPVVPVQPTPSPTPSPTGPTRSPLPTPPGESDGPSPSPNGPTGDTPQPPIV